MEELLRICNSLKSNSSIKEKQKILENKSNILFKEILSFLLNDYIVSGISTKKINKNVGHMTNVNYSDIVNGDTLEDIFISLLNYIKNNNTGRDVDISLCEYCLSKFDFDKQEFIKSIITKTLRLGIDVKTVNKIYGKDFIPIWEVQLGSAAEKLRLKPNEKFYLSRKLNGNRVSFSDGKLISRQGKEFTGMQHIIDDINRLDLQDYFIDGELLRKNVDNVSDSENFRIGTGIINSDTEVKEEIKLVIFDIFPNSELKNKKSNDIYSVRKQHLLSIKEQMKHNHIENLEVVTMVYEGTDKNKIDEWLQYAVDNDWEGCMLNKDTVYECKRTTNLIKIKRFYSMDLNVIGYEEGTGRLSGTLGALIVDFKGNTVNVGSGYDDATRQYIWNNRDSILGKIISVKYKEITKDKKTQLESLQFPVFEMIRTDKDTISYD